MASLKCLHPTHPLLLLHSGSALPAISNRCFIHSSSPYRVLSVNSPRTAPPRAMAKPGFSPAQDQVASPGDFEFVPPLKIVEYPDPKLRAKSKRVVTFDDSLKKLVHEMFDVMYKTDGIGLSAPQVGINVQLMVFNPVGERGEGEEIVLVNPRVSKYSKKLTLFNEGCLSFPGINADVKRPESVKIDARDVNGTRFSVNLSGLPARIFQHEFDHLQGILFFERMTEEVLDSIRGQLQALETKYEGMTGLPSPEKLENRGRRKVPVGFGKL
ncbi:Peptide deformylase 1B [Spatholobus suberectus]|nr:Peptide deformylase 1B [Spatholobus suberectus]